MTFDVSPSWDRFCSRHLGEWTGRSVAISASTARIVSSSSYTLRTKSVAPSRSNPNFVLLSAELNSTTCESGEEHVSMPDVTFRYDTSSFFVFEDGSYSADMRLLTLSSLLPEGSTVPFAIEHALPVSATERVRVFLIYDTLDQLQTVVHCEETREGLFEDRTPLAFTSLLGDWCGQAETLHRTTSSSNSAGSGFGTNRQKHLPRPPLFSKEDLPDELKHSSAGKDGLMRLQTSVSYRWDPSGNAVRRTTALADMSGQKLGTSTIYGRISQDSEALFDIIRCSDNSIIVPLPSGCYVSAPLSKARGVPASSELGCLVTPNYRRRCVRTYSATGLASETVATESMTS
jgi:hypothetical protein